MKTKISIVFLVASLFLTAVPFSFAQTAPNDWNEVRQFPAGTNLFIKTSDGKTLIGSLAKVSDDTIELTVKGQTFLLAKNNLKAVYFAVPKTGKRARLIGAIIGATVVLAAFSAAVEDKGDSGTGAPILPFIAGGLGGGFIGSLFAKARKKAH